MPEHWYGWVEWFEDDGTVVCRFETPKPELLAWIAREDFESTDADLYVGTYVDWVMEPGNRPRVTPLPTYTAEELEAARARAARLARELLEELP